MYIGPALHAQGRIAQTVIDNGSRELNRVFLRAVSDTHCTLALGPRHPRTQTAQRTVYVVYTA